MFKKYSKPLRIIFYIFLGFNILFSIFFYNLIFNEHVNGTNKKFIHYYKANFINRKDGEYCKAYNSIIFSYFFDCKTVKGFKLKILDKIK